MFDAKENRRQVFVAAMRAIVSPLLAEAMGMTRRDVERIVNGEEPMQR
jgi:plasmid maintenance system antidote protein VapI